MQTNNLSGSQAMQVDLVEYLESLGFSPQKIRNNDYWYLSPLRDEKEASFKVNRKFNVWYDHGLGQGGNIIKFGILYHNCSVKELLEKLQETFSFHSPKQVFQEHHSAAKTLPDPAPESKINVIAAEPLIHPTLCNYLKQRKIPFDIAEKYCHEVYFELCGKNYFAIGFKNNSGGYELRNAHFKGSSSPKNITFIQESPEQKEVTVFEGFFSFLSFLTLTQKNIPLTNFLVLNSLAFFEKSRPLMEKHQAINLYLDCDQAGIKNTLKALEWDKKYIDQSCQFKNCKDLNDYLIIQSQEEKKSLRLG